MTKRITLRVATRTVDGDFQAGVEIPVDDATADRLLQAGSATLAENQEVFGHEDEMAPAVRAKAIEALVAADAAAGVNNPSARAAATEPFRNKKK